MLRFRWNSSHIVAIGLCLAALGGGCAAGLGDGPESGGSADDEFLRPVEGVSPRDALEAELVRLRAERDRLAQTRIVLEDELRWAHEDLALVEQQFSEFEQRQGEDFGKAAAVSAMAEARLHLERTRGAFDLADSTSEHVSGLLGTAERLIRSNNYPAALFFAERANHTLQAAERRASLNVGGTAKVVAVTVANVRSGPGQHYAVIATLKKGTPVSCLDVARNWCHIVTRSGATGWVHVSLLR